MYYGVHGNLWGERCFKHVLTCFTQTKLVKGHLTSSILLESLVNVSGST
jgi:hypothetical protein